MKLKIYNPYPKDFVYNYLRDFLKGLVKSDVKKLTKLNFYLYNTLGIGEDAYSILKYCIDCVYTSLEPNNYVLDFDSRIRYKNTKYTVGQLLNLIEYGNLEIKGTHTLTKNLNYIKNNIEYIYNLYLYS